jgi:hypothetical protein
VRPRRGGVGGAVGTVEADDGVEVDQAAPLVFGRAHIRQCGGTREPALEHFDDTGRVLDDLAAAHDLAEGVVDDLAA